MLTLETILRIERFNEALGLSDKGACFGVTDPSRLRPVSQHFQVLVNVLIYRLELNSRNNAYVFMAKNNGLAIIKVMRLLGVKGRLTERKFKKAGGKTLFRRTVQIYPPVKHKR